MPRITEATVAEHVAKQEQVISDAAIRLFTERGFSQVTLADIAAEVGLARTSLYRYYPRTSDILVRWLRLEMVERRRRSLELLNGGGAVEDRLRSWAIDQLEYARRPEHKLVAALPGQLPQLNEATRTELAEAHRELLSPLADVLSEAGIPEASERQAVAELIFGMVLAAARWEERADEDPRMRARLDGALFGLLTEGR